jgi:DNA polymerase III subunit delta'
LRSLAELHQLAGHTLNPRLFLEAMFFSYVKALLPRPRARCELPEGRLPYC